MRIINVKKKKNEIINKRTAEIISMQKFAIFVEKCLKKNMWKIKNIVTLGIIAIIKVI